MNHRTLTWLAFAGFLAGTGCAGIEESSRVIAGTSIRALEEARAEADWREYRATPETCFDSVILFAEQNGVTVSRKDRERLILVLLHLPAMVNSTEVGIFCVPVEEGITRVEIASTSSLGRKKAAQIIFPGLGAVLEEVPAP